ncbi:MAG: autotransporter-associated beta strand repeat-containing protein [Kiritimatiellales bacterium]|nr:autotransporter-associated beta strand repeat-containing protein [Kiritimatiellales bacterium]
MKKMKWIMVAMLLIAGMAQAVNKTWVGNTDTNFSTLANWNPSTTIVANTPVFGAAGTAGTVLYNDLDVGSVINGFTFTTAADSYTLNGNAIKLNGAINALASTVDQVINFDVDINQTISANSRNIAASSNSVSTIFNGSFTGTGGLNMQTAGTGPIILAGNNTFDGKVGLANNTTVIIEHDNALGASVGDYAYTAVTSGGSLQLRNNITVAESFTIAGGTAARGAIRNIGGNNTINGNISETANSTIVSAAGTLTINGNIDGSTYNVDLRGAGDMTVNGAISASGVYVAHGDAGTLSLLGQNSFTGQMRIDKGTVVANTMADTGVASSLGAGDTIRMGWRSNPDATLRYIGGAANTDRQIQVGFDTADTYTAGGKIEQNGSGALNFTATAFNAQEVTATAARTLTLGGSNADTNTIQGVIADNNTAGGGTIGLVKSDAGKWILSGDNTYSGTTMIDGGKLIINGDQSGATGAVTVNANGILGGSGTIGGAVTVKADGTLSAGNSPGTLTFNNDLTLLAGSTNIMEITDSAYDILMGSGGALAIAGETIFDFTGFTGGVTNGFSLSLGSMYVNWSSVDLTGATYSSLGLSGGQSLDFTGGNLTVIPEPATLGLVVAVGGCLVWVRRMFMI